MEDLYHTFEDVDLNKSIKSTSQGAICPPELPYGIWITLENKCTKVMQLILNKLV